MFETSMNCQIPGSIEFCYKGYDDLSMKTIQPVQVVAAYQQEPAQHGPTLS